MRYYRIIIHYLHNDKGTVAYFADLEKYKNENDLVSDIKLCLENDNIAYVHFQETTYNVYNRSELKTPNDFSFGVYNQKLYTKYERFARNNDYTTSFII